MEHKHKLILEYMAIDAKNSNTSHEYWETWSRINKEWQLMSILLIQELGSYRRKEDAPVFVKPIDTRDLFAAADLQGPPSSTLDRSCKVEAVANYAYLLADAMLKERKK